MAYLVLPAEDNSYALMCVFKACSHHWPRIVTCWNHTAVNDMKTLDKFIHLAAGL
jgi:hypothetical protein